MPTEQDLRAQWAELVALDPGSLRGTYMAARRLLAALDLEDYQYPLSISQPTFKTHLTVEAFTPLEVFQNDRSFTLKIEPVRSGGALLSMAGRTIPLATWPVEAFDLATPVGTFRLAPEAAPPFALPVPPATTTTTAAPTTTTTLAPSKSYSYALTGYPFFQQGDQIALVETSTVRLLTPYVTVPSTTLSSGNYRFTYILPPGETAPGAVEVSLMRAGTETRIAQYPAATTTTMAPTTTTLAPGETTTTLAPTTTLVPVGVLTPEPAIDVYPTTTTIAPTTTTLAPTTTTQVPLPEAVEDALTISGNLGARANAQAVLSAIQSLVPPALLEDVTRAAEVFYESHHVEAASAVNAYAALVIEAAKTDLVSGVFVNVRADLLVPWRLSKEMRAVSQPIEVLAQTPASLREFLLGGFAPLSCLVMGAPLNLNGFSGLNALSTPQLKDRLVKYELMRSSAAAVLPGMRAALDGKPVEAADKIRLEIGHAQGTRLFAITYLAAIVKVFNLRGESPLYSDIVDDQLPAALEAVRIEQEDPYDNTNLAMALWNDDSLVASVQGKVTAPQDNSLRSHERRYAVVKNREVWTKGVAADVSNHAEVATGANKAVAEERAAQAALEASFAAGLGTDVTQKVEARGGDKKEMDPKQDPNNPSFWQKFMGTLFKPFGMPEATAKLPVVAIDSLSDLMPSTPRSSLNPNLITSITSNANSALNITNMFQNDFNDFRRTGIVKALYNLQGGETNTNNRNNLASIKLVPESSGNSKVTAENIKNPFPHAGEVNEYNSFMLTGVRESYGEKYQIIETLGEGVTAFFFGKHAEVWTFSGILLNDMYSDQVYRFREFWEHHLRGSKLVEHGLKAAISVPASGLLVRGYPLTLEWGLDATTEEFVSFTMQFWVTDLNMVPLISYVNKETELGLIGLLTVLDGGSLSKGPASESLKRYLKKNPDLANKSQAASRLDGAQNPTVADLAKDGDNIWNRIDSYDTSGTLASQQQGSAGVNAEGGGRRAATRHLGPNNSNPEAH